MNQPKLNVENVVCDANLGSTLELRDVVQLLNGRLDPKVFPAVVSIIKVRG